MNNPDSIARSSMAVTGYLLDMVPSMAFTAGKEIPAMTREDLLSFRARVDSAILNGITGAIDIVPGKLGFIHLSNDGVSIHLFSLKVAAKF